MKWKMRNSIDMQARRQEERRGEKKRAFSRTYSEKPEKGNAEKNR